MNQRGSCWEPRAPPVRLVIDRCYRLFVWWYTKRYQNQFVFKYIYQWYKYPLQCGSKRKSSLFLVQSWADEKLCLWWEEKRSRPSGKLSGRHQKPCPPNSTARGGELEKHSMYPPRPLSHLSRLRSTESTAMTSCVFLSRRGERPLISRLVLSHTHTHTHTHTRHELTPKPETVADEPISS